jgi:hypothetical protein
VQGRGDEAGVITQLREDTLPVGGYIQLELDAPPDWPDGTEVEIHPIQPRAVGDAEGMSPEEIAKILAAMDQLEPFDLTDAEWASWEADRQSRKQSEISNFDDHAEELRRHWVAAND